MTKRTDTIRLGAFLMATGHHVAAWRHPRAAKDAGVDIEHYVSLAQKAEAAKFDMMFLAARAASSIGTIRKASHAWRASPGSSRSRCCRPFRP